MFSFFRRKKAPEAAPPDTSEPAASVPPVAPPSAPTDTPETIASSADSAGVSTVFEPQLEAPEPEPAPAAPEPPPAPEPVESPTRGGWLGRLKSGLRKTGGNPFFVIQFLEALEREGRLRFDSDELCWRFDVDEIGAAPLADNVVELMTRRIQSLPSKVQYALTLAACIRR